MGNRLGLKVAAIAALSVVLLLGLTWIGSIVTERQARRDGVIHDIAASSSYAQRIEGPILVVPYQKTRREWKYDSVNGRHMEEFQVPGRLLILPEELELDGRIPTELRKRSIYAARLYHSNLKIHATFDIPAHYGVGDDWASYQFEPPAIALGLSDIRGIQNASKI